MRRLASSGVAIGLIAVFGTSAFGAAPAVVQPWTQISTYTAIAGQSAGLLRTADGRLHVVWASNNGTDGYSLRYSTLAGTRLLSVGWIARGWKSVSFYPRLVPNANGGIRVIFTGADGTSTSPYNLNVMYSATTGKSGQTWKLTAGSMSMSTPIPVTGTAAVAETDGTPVAGWPAGANFGYHVGLDATSPATAADQTLSAGTGAVVVDPTMVRDKSGEIWAGWFNGSGTASRGYYVTRILPTLTTTLRAPSSGGATLANNQPLESMALAARVGGGVYLAYCVPTQTGTCSHVNLWRAGAAKALQVPGSRTGKASHVAIAAAPGGYLWIAWYDSGLHEIKVVRTNAAASGFGTVQAISGPPGLTALKDLQGEASLGPLDLVTLVQVNSFKFATPAYWVTELKP